MGSIPAHKNVVRSAGEGSAAASATLGPGGIKNDGSLTHAQAVARALEERRIVEVSTGHEGGADEGDEEVELAPCEDDVEGIDAAEAAQQAMANETANQTGRSRWWRAVS